MGRRYTVDEANAALPAVRESVLRLRDARRIVIEHGERVRGSASRNGGGAEGAAYWEALRTMRTELEHLAGEGVILRDTESGLLDFPSEREGREIQLCWKLGEDRVTHWHEIDAGFSNRRPL
ncbi:MAG TPA: DUF2203 domain-containing protein [Actinomycetota bacterium]|nr:DUF2203 domain-containing protein [Actinomycetota bacterium]